eukprot:comp12700_c0_seq1/m.7797 comp12700_c0_seq1/g.7797  ORF comp12700_c0_seq1/g.7797 comp12700_c0_seq1/m.7797 type:complete len:454 (-) comp12700_c0_seq1:584-1945(-)
MLNYCVLGALLALSALCDGAIELNLHKKAGVSARSLRRRAAPNGTFPVTLVDGLNSPVAAYVADVTVGTQLFQFIMDTGSSDLLVVGSGCKAYAAGTCAPTAASLGTCTSDGPYLMSGNNTGLLGNDCYGTSNDQTFANYSIFTDKISFGGATAPTQYLGAITAETVNMWGQGRVEVDGLMGLAYPILSAIYGKTNGAGTPVLNTLVNQGAIANSFAMCFNPSGTGGLMVLGGGVLPNLQYTPITQQQWYMVGMSSMSINGTALTLQPGWQTIVDSGTSDLVVPGETLVAIANVLCPALVAAGAPPTVCTQTTNGLQVTQNIVMMSPSVISQLPNITISLPGVTVTVPPTNYFQNLGAASAGTNAYSYGISTDGLFYGSRNSVSIILGDVFLQGQWVYFDRINSRVGFAPITTCQSQNYSNAAPPTSDGVMVCAGPINVWVAVVATVAAVLAL